MRKSPIFPILTGVGVYLILSGKKMSRAPSPNELKFTPILTAAATRAGIPPQYLVNMARTESAFNPDAVGPMTRWGRALGIMQIMPRFHPDINASDPIASINYAADYLAGLYRKFKTWDKAIAAYNWGPDNVAKYWPNMPAETRKYLQKVKG